MEWRMDGSHFSSIATASDSQLRLLPVVIDFKWLIDGWRWTRSCRHCQRDPDIWTRRLMECIISTLMITFWHILNAAPPPDLLLAGLIYRTDFNFVERKQQPSWIRVNPPPVRKTIYIILKRLYSPNTSSTIRRATGDQTTSIKQGYTFLYCCWKSGTSFSKSFRLNAFELEKAIDKLIWIIHMITTFESRCRSRRRWSWQVQIYGICKT